MSRPFSCHGSCRGCELVGADRRNGNAVRDRNLVSRGSHIDLLADKLNTQMAFVNTGQIVQVWPGFKDGKEVARHEGAMAKPQLSAFVDANL